MDNLLDETELSRRTKQISKKYFDKPFKHTVKYNSRLRTTGGRYLPAKKTIEINPRYIIEMDEAEVNGIIKHELCHYHLHIEGKGYKHGDQAFKDLLKSVGAPRYCKPLPSTKNKPRYQYVCEKCQQVYIRRRRVNVEKYRCGICSGKIIFIERA